MMKKLPFVLIGILVGVVFSAFIFYLARTSAPTIINLDDALNLAEYATSRELGLSEAGTELFIGSEYGQELIDRLSKKYPKINFTPYAGRPAGQGCSIAPCVEGNRLGVEVRFPFWRVAFVSVSHFNGGRELTIIKIADRWRTIADVEWVIWSKA